MSSDFIRIDKASLTYGEEGGVLALQDIDLTLKQGEFLAVVGPSGCGKSTLLKLISGLRPPTGGSVTVSGQTVTGPLKIIGMAFQNPTLLPWRTALENVLLPLEVVDPHRRRFRADRRTYENKARKLLGTVGLTGFEDHYPWQLSGGMQQRVSLCRALIHEPALLMLDEPFGALDTFTREELWEALQALWLERRFTTLLVTHDLQEAAMLADRIIIISHRPGRISAECPVDFPRPRALDLRFAPDFNALLHDVRAKIDVARQVPLSGGAA